MRHGIIQLCKHVVAKVTLVPCSVKLTGKRAKVGHGEVTINNARIINKDCQSQYLSGTVCFVYLITSYMIKLLMNGKQ